jgi:hypothetical protein
VWRFQAPHWADPLQSDVDRNSRARISAVIKVVAIIDIVDVDVVGVIPVISPVFRPRVNRTDPVAVILETRISTNNQEGQPLDPEPMVWTKVSSIAVVRDAVAMVAAALLPGAVV